MSTDETVETIEDDYSDWGFSGVGRESFEFLEELIEDFDAALEKRRNQSLQWVGYKWPKSWWLDREELLNEIRRALRELRVGGQNPSPTGRSQGSSPNQTSSGRHR